MNDTTETEVRFPWWLIWRYVSEMLTLWPGSQGKLHFTALLFLLGFYQFTSVWWSSIVCCLCRIKIFYKSMFLIQRVNRSLICDVLYRRGPIQSLESLLPIRGGSVAQDICKRALLINRHCDFAGHWPDGPSRIFMFPTVSLCDLYLKMYPHYASSMSVYQPKSFDRIGTDWILALIEIYENPVDNQENKLADPRRNQVQPSTNNQNEALTYYGPNYWKIQVYLKSNQQRRGRRHSQKSWTRN